MAGVGVEIHHHPMVGVADPIASLLDALEDGEQELPEMTRRIVELVVHALHTNSERIAQLARALGGKSSHGELREATDAMLADVRLATEAARARQIDALSATAQLESRLSARLEAAATASSEAMVALDASILHRVAERAASRGALEAAVARIDELGARLERLESAHVAPAQLGALDARASDASERLLRAEGALARLEGALPRLAGADEQAALASEVEAVGARQRELLAALDSRGGRAELADACGRVRTLEERLAVADARLGELPSARELRGAVEERERVREVERAQRALHADLAACLRRDELGAALAPLASASDVNGAIALVKQTRDDYRALAAETERRLEAVREQAGARGAALDAADRALGAQLAELAARADGVEARQATDRREAADALGALAAQGPALAAAAVEAGARGAAEAASAALRAELLRAIELSAQQSTLVHKAVSDELGAQLDRCAAAADVRELWEETQAQLSALGAAGAQLRTQLDGLAARSAASADDAERALGEARKLLLDQRALQDALRRELASKAGHAELHAEARRAAREAVEPMLALQRAELDERAAELRKLVAERASAIRDALSDELEALQRGLRGKAAVADVQAAAADVRAAVAASQDARLVALRAEALAQTDAALHAWRASARKALGQEAARLRDEAQVAIGAQVAEALAAQHASNQAELLAAVHSKAADAERDATRRALHAELGATRRALGAAELAIERKADMGQVEEAVRRALHAELDAMRRAHGATERALERKADVGHVDEAVRRALGAAEAAMERKADLGHVDEAVRRALGAELDAVRRALGAAEAALERKADVGHVDAAVRRALEAAELALERKADLGHVDSAVHRALDAAERARRARGAGSHGSVGLQTDGELLRRASVAAREPSAPSLDELARVVGEQRGVLEPLWAESQVARWAWFSHKLRSVGRGTLRLVPWDSQRINTDPEGYAYEKQQPLVTVAQPGPYALTAAFFSKRRPLTIRIHVNGAPVLAKASDGHAKHIDASGSVAGVVLQTVVMLPKGAQVAVEYTGDERDATGLLSLRKL